MLMYRVYERLYEFAEARGLRVERVLRTVRSDEQEEGTMKEEARIKAERFENPVLTPERVFMECVSQTDPNRRTHIALLSEYHSALSPKEVIALVNVLRHDYVQPLKTRASASSRSSKTPKAKGSKVVVVLSDDEDTVLPGEQSGMVVEVIIIYHPKDGSKAERPPAAEHVHLYPYHLFTHNPLQHYLASPAVLLSPEEGERMMRERLVTEKTMRRILRSDPAAIWLGAAPGRVIRERKVSEATGYQDECYYVV